MEVLHLRHRLDTDRRRRRDDADSAVPLRLSLLDRANSFDEACGSGADGVHDASVLHPLDAAPPLPLPPAVNPADAQRPHRPVATHGLGEPVASLAGGMSLAEITGVREGDAEHAVVGAAARDRPRCVFRPAHAVAVMLILVLALCASLTMLVQQSLNFTAAEAPRARPSSSQPGAGERASTSPPEAGPSQETGSEQRQQTAEPSSASNEESDQTQAPEQAGTSNLVNLNTADAEELQTLNGVGPVTAERILAYRAGVGRFSSVDQLLGVDGIGVKTLQKLRSQVTVS